MLLLHNLYIINDVKKDNNINIKSLKNLESIYITNLFTFNYSIFSKKLNYSKLIFFIESCANNMNKRKKIKSTWINECLKLSCNYYFIIATRGKLEKIKNENNNDIIGVDIVDSYYNLTILTSYIYKYYNIYNLLSDYVIKIDDDIYPNIPIIIIYINLYINKLKISGYYYKKMNVNRNRYSTNYLPKSIYPSDIFPNFVAGGFVIINSNLIILLYKELLKEKRFIYREDMHMGVIYANLNLKLQKLNYYYHRRKLNITLKNKLNDICWHGY